MSSKRMTAFKYVELAAVLRAQILSGSIRPGEMLLSESELCRKYSVSRTSVRQALDILATEGLVERVVGVGTIVKTTPMAVNDDNNLIMMTDYPLSYVRHTIPLLIEMFKQKHPLVNIKLISLPYTEKYKTESPQNWPIQPDIVLFDDEFFQRQSTAEFHPFSDMAFAEGEVGDKLLQPYMANGSLFALPVTFSPIFMVCNRDLFQKYMVPLPSADDWTIEQFMNAARNLTHDTNDDGVKDIYGYGLSTKLSRWATIALKFGHDFSGWGPVQHSPRSDKRALLEALRLNHDILYKHQITPAIAARDLEWIQQLFYKGKIAMLLTSTFYNIYKVPFHSEIFPFPSRQHTEDTGNVLMSLGMGIPRSSARSELAKIFCEFACKPDVQQVLVEKTGLLSVYNKVNRSTLKKRQYDRMGLDAGSMEKSHYIFELFPSVQAANRAEEIMTGFWAGVQTPEETADLLMELK